MILTIAKIIVIWTLASIIAAECFALMRANQHSRQREASELADAIELGGAADSIPFHVSEVDHARQ